MTAETRDWITELLADATWTRRLAGALLGDATSAEDAVQEVWMRTRGAAPPGLEDRRGWIRRVLTNALRSRRRGERRRLAREQASAGDGLAGPIAVRTPEDLLGRLEVHRTLAVLVAALAEPGRKVLLLHYYEGMTSAQIAAATGVPAGTVRWRLKSALDELRAELDRHYAAEKTDWRRALAPLLPAGWATRNGSAAGKTGLVLGLLLAGATVMVLVALFETGPAAPEDGPLAEARATLDPDRALGAGGPGSVVRAAGPGGPAPVAMARAAIARPCHDEIRALEADLAAAREALDYHLPPRNVWAEARDDGQNVAAQQAIGPAVARWLDDKGAPAAGRSIDCRRDACIVKVLEPWPPKPSWITREPSAAAQAVLQAHARDIGVEGAKRHTRLLGADEAESQIWFRLHALSGAASQREAPPLPTSLLPSAALRAGRPPDEGPLTADCRERKGALEGEIEKLRRRSVSLVSAPLLFQSERPNPALAAKLQIEIDRFVRAGQALPEGDRPPPLRTDCRGSVCRVTAVEGALPESVLRPLLKDEGFATQVRRTSAHTVNGRVKDGLYVTVLPPPSETSSGEDVLRHFLKQVRGDPGVQLCTHKFPPSGTLSLRFVLPATGEVNEDGLPERISFQLGGPVAESPHGRCLAEAFARLAAAFVPPSGISRAEVSKTVELPE